MLFGKCNLIHIFEANLCVLNGAVKARIHTQSDREKKLDLLLDDSVIIPFPFQYSFFVEMPKKTPMQATG